MDKQDKDVPKNLGGYIKFVRQIKGFRLRDISEKSGISIAYLSRLENSKRASPSQEILRKLSATLDISLMALLQISLDVNNNGDKNLENIILEGEYTIDGVEISQEARILLWNVIEYILDDNHSIEEISRTYIDDLISRIKLLNKSL